MTGRANNRKTRFNENMNNRVVELSLLAAMAALLVSLPWLRAEEPAEPSFDTGDIGVPHAECTFFTAKREHFLRAGLGADLLEMTRRAELTASVSAALPQASFPSRSRSGAYWYASQGGDSIDEIIFNALKIRGIPPAASTTDTEFLRRVTLDLTGRIPTIDEVVDFLNDPSAGKRAQAIERLLATPQWADRWAMFLGDLYRNTLFTSQVIRYLDGRDAFHLFLLESLQQNKPYDEMVREILTANGTGDGRKYPDTYSSFDEYEQITRDYVNNPVTPTPVSYIVGGLTLGGPIHDTYDALANRVALDFLGLAHMDCILCHDGYGHLDSLSVWGAQAKRSEGWGLAASFAGTIIRRGRPPPPPSDTEYVPPPRYWIVGEIKRPRFAYVLNTTTGNRPARLPDDNGGEEIAAATYPFGGGTAQAGESDREALGRLLTADMQFSRAIVNYIWKEFFSRGIVEPPDQFDPLRLDSENPPPTPWQIQPSHPELLDLLAQGFVDNGFDLKWLMRQITNSRAYQFSSRYEGAWSPSYEPFFARHQVRRLTAEQLHDAIVTSSGLPIPYLVSRAIGFVPLAMQFPDVQFVPLGERRRGDAVGDNFAAAATRFLDAFLRGNREETRRSSEGSILQALELMNSALVVDRISAGSTGGTMALLLQQPDDVLVQGLYLAVLGRLPSTDELALGVATLADGDRVENTEDLMWTLYNTVEFIFNH